MARDESLDRALHGLFAADLLHQGAADAGFFSVAQYIEEQNRLARIATNQRWEERARLQGDAVVPPMFGRMVDFGDERVLVPPEMLPAARFILDLLVTDFEPDYKIR